MPLKKAKVKGQQPDTKRQHVEKHVQNISETQFEGTVERIIGLLQGILKKHPNSYIRRGYSYDEPEYRVYQSRPETDEEMAARIKRETEYAASQLERDREQYERLKKQFEGK